MLPTDAIAYSGLGLLVAGQAAGAPLPAETALIGAAVLAARGQLDIVAVIVVAAAAATLGGFVGVAVGSALGRPALARLAWERPRIGALIAVGERFFARHGAKAVFLARWVSGVRIVATPVAGERAMPVGKFAWSSSKAVPSSHRLRVLVRALVDAAGAVLNRLEPMRWPWSVV